MSQKTEQAAALFKNGYNCAQAVLVSFCDELGLEKNTAFKTACGFGAGMGRKGGVCGAVSGGIMALGARFGRGESGEPAETAATYGKINALISRFTEKHGTVCCRELLDGCDLGTSDGQQMFTERAFKTKICTPCVETAAALVEGLLG